MRLLPQMMIGAVALALASTGAVCATGDAYQQRRLESEREAVARGEGTPVRGETLALPVLQKRILGALVVADQGAAPECSEHSVMDTQVVARNADDQSILERWTLDRCGRPVAYQVRIAPYQPALRGVIVVDELASVSVRREDDVAAR